MRTAIRLPLLAALLAALAACGRAPSAPAANLSSASAQAASDFSVHDLESRWRDQDGDERTLGSLAGKTRVVAMVYTSCAHTCPMIVAEMKRLEAALPAAERGRVGFVLFSLDPARDRPEQLAKFASALRLAPESWTLLTGDDGSVRELAALLGIRYRAETGAEISHSNTYLVLDAAGRVVHRQDGIGSGTEAALARIRAAARDAR
jgi:protein SCO1